MTVITIVTLVGCRERPGTPTIKESLNKHGIFGYHELAQTESFGVTKESLSGDFFLIGGSFDTTTNAEIKLQFYWSPKNGEYVVSMLPYTKFRFIIDESKLKPTIEFVFNNDWLEEKDYGHNIENNRNINDIISSKHLQLAEIRLSKASMEKEIYLPKTR